MSKQNASPIHVRILEVGTLGVNCAILTRDDKALVIDPGGEADAIGDALGDATLAAILITHGHYDHIGALNPLRARFPDAEVLCHPDAVPYLTDATCNLSLYISGSPLTGAPPTQTVAEGGCLTLADIGIRVFHIPGHCHGQVAYEVEEVGMLFCGDTVFAGGIGRSDLAGGDEAALVSVSRKVLASLPPETVLIPGHGPRTTAARELQTNPFL